MHRSHPSISRRKHLMKEMMEDDYALPTETQQIARVISSRGNNLHEVETVDETFLGEWRIKSRKTPWLVNFEIAIAGYTRFFGKYVTGRRKRWNHTK